MGRVAVFIDGAYLDHVLLNEFQGQRVDYHLLAKNLIESTGQGKELLRIYYYHCLPWQGSPPTPEQQKRFSEMQRFFRALQRTSKFEVRLGRLAHRGLDAQGRPILEQKRIDLMLGLDLALLATKRLITEAFVVAGDSDLIPAINAVKAEGVTIYLVHGASCHDDLLDEADERIPITEALIGKASRML